MLSPNHLYPHLSQKVMSEVTNIIENYLLHEWAINIEYTDDIQYLNTRWNKWGETFFRNYDSSHVVDEIFFCHSTNPLCAMRLHAERFTPSSCLYFSICSVSTNTKNT